MQLETDLILEATELWRSRPGDPGELPGIVTHRRQREGAAVTEVEVLNQVGAEAVGKPVGRYLTLELESLDGADRHASRLLAEELRTMLPEEGAALVVGLGNRSITPDAVGGWAAESTLVTRHLVQRYPERFGSFREVAAVTPGVLGTTGMESGEMVEALCRRLRPSVVIAVDALAARSPSRLCCTIQLADSGIVPGSGVGNARFALNRETLGVPVIAVGVPTVIRASALAGEGAAQKKEALEGLIVTPKDIDAQAEQLAKIIGLGITMALQEELTEEEAAALLA